LAHFELISFLASATGLLALISFCLLVFGRLGVGSIVAFLIAGLVVGQMRDLPPASVQALQEFAELGVILLLFLIGLELSLHRLLTMRRLVFGLGGLQVLLTTALLGGGAALGGGQQNARFLGTTALPRPRSTWQYVDARHRTI